VTSGSLISSKTKDIQYRNSKQVLNVVLAILAEIQRSNFIAVYEDWIGRLKG
jgi:hypothetical protein